MNAIPPLGQEKQSDLELVGLVKSGDPSAFPALLERFIPAITAAAGRYRGVAGLDMDDFTQDAMVALFRAVKGYRPDGGAAFSTYAIAAINNAVSAGVKRQLASSRDIGVDIEELDAIAYSNAPQDPAGKPVEDIYLDREAAGIRAAKIETLLSDFERRVLKLYLGGHTYCQISEILGTSTKAVDNALQRVRRKLQSQ